MARTTRTGRGVDGRPGRRYEMTDAGYERIEDLLPRQRRGGKWSDHRTVINGMFWVLNSGARWRDMPERYGKWQTVYGRYRRWVGEGLIDFHVPMLRRGHEHRERHGEPAARGPHQRERPPGEAKDAEETLRAGRLRATFRAVVVVRPDQYVAHVLPLSATDELSAFFAQHMVSQR